MRSSTTVFALLLLPAVATAQVYKWTDAEGHVHFSQSPPKSGTYDEAGSAPPPGTSPNVQQLDSTQKQADKDADKAKAQADQDAADKAKKQADCKQAQDRLSYMDEHQARRLYTKDDKGNVSRMTQDDFTKQRQEVQDRISKNCGG